MGWRDDVTAHITHYLSVNYNAMRDYIISHAIQHITGGEQPIPVATTTATGLCPILDDDADHFLNGDGGWTTPSYAPSDHATDHITGGGDIIPVATVTATGLCPVLSNDETEFLNGLGGFSTPITYPNPIILFPIGAVIPSTNQPIIDIEELSNGVKYVYAEYSHTVEQNLQWLIRMPTTWDGGTLNFSYYWTTTSSGSGTADLKIKTRAFVNGSDLNATLTTVTTIIDTTLGANKLMISAKEEVVPEGAGYLFVINISRDVTSSSRLMAGIRLLAVIVDYNSN